MADVALVIVLSLLTSTVGAAGGLGGAVLLVPLLAITGMPASIAAPLGLVSVAASSIAAADMQLTSKLVNHRLGVTTEIAATTGATMGALVSSRVGDRALTISLGVVAAGAALAMLRSRIEQVAPELVSTTAGEWPGQLAGVSPVTPPRDTRGVVYRAQRVPLSLGMMWMTGVVAGVTGASGGFIKTPVTTEIMRVPMKVAAATTTFTVGVTAATGLVVFTVQGRMDPRAAAAVVAGSLVGGLLGAKIQHRVPTSLLRRGLGLALLAIAVLLTALA